MTLTRYGIREWGAITAVCGGVGLALGWFGIWVGVAITAVVWVALVAFFRDPAFRKPATDAPNDMVSPADGKVSAIEDVAHHAAVGGPAKVVRIFLSVLDVHVNRYPCDGVVASVTHTPGKYLDARTPESAKENESTVMVLAIPSGERIGVKQISGAIARRIVCPVKPGGHAKRGERYGMIKFGSTTELVVPTSEIEKVCVAKGDRVKGGVTVLVRMKRI